MFMDVPQINDYENTALWNTTINITTEKHIEISCSRQYLQKLYD